MRKAQGPATPSNVVFLFLGGRFQTTQEVGRPVRYLFVYRGFPRRPIAVNKSICDSFFDFFSLSEQSFQSLVKEMLQVFHFRLLSGHPLHSPPPRVQNHGVRIHFLVSALKKNNNVGPWQSLLGFMDHVPPSDGPAPVPELAEAESIQAQTPQSCSWPLLQRCTTVEYPYVIAPCCTNL